MSTAARTGRGAGEALLIVLAVTCPLAFGGVHAPVLLALIVVAALALLLRPTSGPVEVPGLVFVVAALAALTALQLVPLPRGLLASMTPATDALLASSVDRFLPGRTGAAHALTLAAPETALSVGRTVLVGLALLAGYAAARSSGEAPVRRALLLALAATLAVVLAHAVLGGDRIYGLLPARGRGISAVQGPFVNCNHLGSFLCLLLPLALAEALRATTRRRAAIALALAGLAFAVSVATLSRGALLGLGLGVGAFALLERRRLFGRVGVAPVVAVGLGTVAFSALAADALSGGRLRRLLAPETLLDGSGKLGIWRMAAAVLGDHPVTGVGRGAFASVHWGYRTGPHESQAAWAESSYLQLLVDVGLPAAIAILLAGCLLLGRPLVRCVLDGRRTAFGSAGAAGLLALGVHEVFDFSLASAGVAVPAALLAGGLLAAGRAWTVPIPTGWIRSLAVLATLAALAGVAWAGPRLLRSSDARIAHLAPEEEAEALELAALHPADPWGWSRVGAARVARDPAGALELAGLAMQLDPMGSEPHRVAAAALLNLGAEDQALLEMRLAIARATWDLPGLVEGVVERWPDEEDRLSVLPEDRAQAIRVVHLLNALEEPDLASAAWTRIQARREP